MASSTKWLFEQRGFKSAEVSDVLPTNQYKYYLLGE